MTENKGKKIHLISLGCSKNLVDSERMLYSFLQKGWELTQEAEEADLILVNTCGFIDPAKQEAIDTLLEMDAVRKEGALLVAAGCMAQRYPEELYEQMPEIDLVIGIDQCEEIADWAEAFDGRKIIRKEPDRVYHSGKRVYTGAVHYAYVRIADGCDNFCSYCAIPGIRGRYRSRAPHEIMEEVRQLAEQGVTEIILIAQDTTRYGSDLKNGEDLNGLLQEIAAVDGIRWIRFLYAYPEKLTDEILDTMIREEKICRYVDIPIQHCNDRILKKMNRKVTRAQLDALMQKLRGNGFTVRTTVMTGFPGETEEEHEELLEFLQKNRFDRLGAFAFCPEDGTPAARMPDQIPEETKARRLEEIMLQQQGISYENNRERIGTVCECVIDGFDEERCEAIARSREEVPDVDGVIRIDWSGIGADPVPGMMFDVRITDATPYDLIGRLNDDEE